MKHIKPILLIVLFLASCVPTIQSPTPTQTPTITSTPAPTATQTASPTPTIVPTPTPLGGGSGSLIFEYLKAGFKEKFPDLMGETNIFTVNSDGTDLVPITNGLKGYNYIESISPDGSQVLVSSFSSPNIANGDLYLVNIDTKKSKPLKLASGLLQRFGYGPIAKWVNKNDVVYLGKGKDGTGIYVLNIHDISNPNKIGSSSANSILSVDSTRVYWQNLVKKSFKDEDGFVYISGSFIAFGWTNIDGSAEGNLESNGKQIVTRFSYNRKLAFSSDGKSIAWIPAEHEPNCRHEHFIAGWLRDGVYTKHAGEIAPGVFDKNNEEYGKVIDTTYVEAYAQRCFIMYVASLSEMDNPTKVVLMPPSIFFYKEFTFGEDYGITWPPDGSKILLFYPGVEDEQYPQPPVIFYAPINSTKSDATEISLLYNDFSNKLADKIFVTGFSPDGQQLLLYKHNSENASTKFFNLNDFTNVNYFGYKVILNHENSIDIYWLP